MNKTENILLISPEPWGDNYVSKHNYAIELSNKYNVYYLNPPNSKNEKLNSKSEKSIRSIRDNLFVVNYRNNLPKLNSLPKVVQKNSYKKQAVALHKLLGVEQFDVIWSFDPYRFWNIRDFNGKKFIYHIVDDHNASFENEIVQSADVVLSVSKFFNKKFDRELQFVSHGYQNKEWEKEATFVLPETNKIKVSLLGNFRSDNIDFENLLDLTDRFKTELEFIMIGPVGKNNLNECEGFKSDPILESLKFKKNVTFVGEQHESNLELILNWCDVHLIMYKDYTKNIAPHKILHYLNSGKVVLSSFIYDKDHFPKDTLFMVDESNGFGAEMSKLISNLEGLNSETNQKLRKAFCENNSYKKKVEKVLQLISE